MITLTFKEYRAVTSNAIRSALSFMVGVIVLGSCFGVVALWASILGKGY